MSLVVLLSICLKFFFLVRIYKKFDKWFINFNNFFWIVVCFDKWINNCLLCLVIVLVLWRNVLVVFDLGRIKLLIFGNFVV